MADIDTEIEGLEEEGETEETVTHQNGEAVQNRIKALESQQALNALLADPDIRKVLEAKQKGQKVQVSDLVEEETEEVEEEPEEIAALDDKDPLKNTLRTIDSLINKKAGKLVDRIKELEAELEEVKGFAGSVQKKEVQTQVAAAQQKYPDFAKYREKMLEITKANPGLGVEELYLIAKARSGDLKMEKPSTFSERPQGSQRANPRKPVGQKPNRPRGRAGFSAILQDALNDLDLSTSE